MHFGILGNVESWYVEDLTRAAAARDVRCERIDYRLLSGGVLAAGAALRAGELDLRRLDAVIVRTMPPGSLEQIVFRMDLLARLEAEGVIVLNAPRTIEQAVDKYLATARLAASGLPVPETIACESEHAAWLAFDELGGDVVVKPVFGAEGRGVMRVSNPDMALRVFRTLERLQAVLYLQRFVAHPGYDLRILVLDGESLGAMRRYAQDGFKTNIACQGRAERCEPSPHELQLALRATEAVGARLCGVDLLTGPGGETYVIEVNGVPGWRAFQSATGVDVADRVIGSLARQVARRSRRV